MNAHGTVSVMVLFWRKQAIRTGWLLYTVLVMVTLTTLLVLSLDTWASASMNSMPRPHTHDDRLSSTITTASRSRGTTAEPLLWLPQQEPIDLRRFPLHSRRLYSQDAKDGITAVFPVSESSFSDFDLNFDSILSAYATHSLIFYEIVVACHPRIATKATHTIDKARGTYSVEISVTVLPWGQSDDPSSGMLHILPSILTSRVLLLDITGLRYIEESTQIMLLESLPINFPIGTCGVLVSPYNISCIQSLEHTVPAAYLIPPILAPTVLLIEAENGVKVSENTWAALGDRIVKTTGAGFGGLVLKNSGQSYRWCAELLTLDPVFTSKFPRSHYDLLREGAEHRLFSSTRLNVLFPGRHELKSFSPTICEMARHGYTLRVMLFSCTERNPSSYFALDMGCHIHFEVISHDMSTAILTKRLQAWIHAADFDVLMYTSEQLVHTMVIEASVESFKLSGRTVVRIPTVDLPFCEWMAMLSASDWRRK
ncbi:hypothetical protein JB92DRAFT_1855771 [Gautieria morchelliformis]|nr:hypothetical protein JB92DRAFT_1855771 [Gautieria morchelliformis]